MPPTVLTLSSHPHSNDVWACSSTLKQVITELEQTGIDAKTPVSPTNRTRVLHRFMAPYMDNIADVSAELEQRADNAEAQFLTSPTDVAFDRAGLVTTIARIRDLRDDVRAYLDLAQNAASLPDDEQREYLATMVYAPFFRGAGFNVIGDDTSPWVDSLSVYCRPVLLGAALSRAAHYHEKKWVKMGPHKGVGVGTLVLGAVALTGVVMFLRR